MRLQAPLSDHKRDESQEDTIHAHLRLHPPPSIGAQIWLLLDFGSADLLCDVVLKQKFDRSTIPHAYFCKFCMLERSQRKFGKISSYNFLENRASNWANFMLQSSSFLAKNHRFCAILVGNSWRRYSCFSVQCLQEVAFQVCSPCKLPWSALSVQYLANLAIHLWTPSSQEISHFSVQYPTSGVFILWVL